MYQNKQNGGHFSSKKAWKLNPTRLNKALFDGNIKDMPWKTMKLCTSDIEALYHLNFDLIFARNPMKSTSFCPRCQNFKGFKEFLCTYVKENKIEANNICVCRVLQGF